MSNIAPWLAVVAMIAAAGGAIINFQHIRTVTNRTAREIDELAEQLQTLNTDLDRTFADLDRTLNDHSSTLDEFLADLDRRDASLQEAIDDLGTA